MTAMHMEGDVIFGEQVFREVWRSPGGSGRGEHTAVWQAIPKVGTGGWAKFYTDRPSHSVRVWSDISGWLNLGIAPGDFSPQSRAQFERAALALALAVLQ